MIKRFAVAASVLAVAIAAASADAAPLSIYFDSQRPSPSQAAVWSMDTNGQNQKLFVAGGSEPSWSADGTKMLYIAGEFPHCRNSGATGGAMTIVDSSGTNPKHINGACGDARLSPDGTRVAYESAPDVLSVLSLADPNHPTQLVYVPVNGMACINALKGPPDRSGACSWATEPSWSGSSTVVYSNDGSPGGGLWSMPASGSTMPALIADDNSTGGINYGISGMSVGSGGGRVVVSAQLGSDTAENLYVIPFGGSTGTRIATAPPGHEYVFPQFSPDGGTVVFEDDVPGVGSTIDSVSAGGGAVTVLTPGDHTARNPTFGPSVRSATRTVSGDVQAVQGIGTPEGLPGVTVRVDGTDSTGHAVHLNDITDADGNYQIPNVPEGQYTITPVGDPPGGSLEPGTEFPPAAGRYVPISCDGTQTGSGCELITALLGEQQTDVTANFGYGRDERIQAVFDPSSAAPTAIQGFAQSTLTITAPDGQGRPARNQFVGVDFGLSPAGHEGRWDGIWLCDGSSRIWPYKFGHYFPNPGFSYTETSTKPDGQRQLTVLLGSRIDPVLSLSELANRDPPPDRKWELQFSAQVESGLGNVFIGEVGGTEAIIKALLYAREHTGGPSVLDAVNGDEAQQIILDWLVALRARGLLNGIDFGPISTTNTPSGHPAVALWASADETAWQVIPTAGISVMEPWATGGPWSHFVVLDVQDAMRLTATGTPILPTLDKWRARLGPLADVWPGAQSDVRAEQVPDQYYGFPLPPPPTVPGGFRYYQCAGRSPSSLPRIVLHSPVRLLITDRHGHRLGIDGHGRRFATLPGFVSAPSHGPALYEFAPGVEHLQLTATGSGRATLVLYPAGSPLAAPMLFTFPVRRGQDGTLTVNSGRPSGVLRFGGHAFRPRTGVGLRLRGLPRALPRRSRLVRLTVTDQFSQAVPGVTVALRVGRGQTTSLSDAHGAVTVRLPSRGSRLRIVISAPTFRKLVVSLR